MSAADKLRDLHAAMTPGEWRDGLVSRRCIKDHKHGQGQCDYSEIDFIDCPGGHVICSTNGADVAGNYDYEEGGIINPADVKPICDVRNALPDIIAVIAAAERSCDAYTREAEDWNDGEFALWSKDDLVEAIVAQRSALAALNARLTDDGDGGEA